MTKKICAECGKAAETNSEKCELCGGKLVPVESLKGPKPKTTKFSGQSDLNKESQGDFSPVAIRAIKPKEANRTIIDIGKQEKRTPRQKLKTACIVAVTILLAFGLAMSIRHFFGDYNVKFSEDNVQKRQNEQMQD